MKEILEKTKKQRKKASFELETNFNALLCFTKRQNFYSHNHRETVMRNLKKKRKW